MRSSSGSRNDLRAGVHEIIGTGAYRLRVVCFALLLPCFCSAQSAGKLRFIVDPGHNFEFVLDHQYRMQQREIELSTGPHHFTFWAPERRMVDTTITVLAGHTKDVVLRLPYSDDYRRFERELRRSTKESRLKVALPAVATVACGAFALTSYSKYKAAHQQLLDDQEAYINGADPNALRSLREVTIPSNQRQFEDRERVWALSAGLFTAVAATSSYLIIRASKNKAPSFHDGEKVKFDGLVWLPGNNGGYFQTGMHIELR